MLCQVVPLARVARSSWRAPARRDRTISAISGVLLQASDLHPPEGSARHAACCARPEQGQGFNNMRHQSSWVLVAGLGLTMLSSRTLLAKTCAQASDCPQNYECPGDTSQCTPLP